MRSNPSLGFSFRAPLTVLAAAVAIAHCSSQPPEPLASPSTVLAHARSQAAADADLRGALEAPAASGFSEEGGAFVSSGVRALHAEPQAVLTAETGPTADAPWRVGVSRNEAFGLRVAMDGVRPSQASLEEGSVVYPDIDDATSSIVTSTRSRAEVFYWLERRSAPRSWRWRIARGPGLSSVRKGDDGAVEFADAQGRTRLRVPQGIAVDASGKRWPVRVAWKDEGLSFDLDAPGASYPILVDPTIEVPSWVLARPDGMPVAVSPAMAFDSARNRVVRFGGNAFNDTWEWDGATWSSQTPAGSPAARFGHAMAYDSVRQRVVLVGGQLEDGSGSAADTWEWDGATWQKRSDSFGGVTRTGHQMAFDSARGRVVLFGGLTGSPATPLADTWEWDGATWTSPQPALHPLARSGHAMTFDTTRGRTVLYGGTAGNDTWEWDGATWAPKSPATRPNATVGAAMAFDPASNRAVLFGGSNGTTPLSETWAWDGANWSSLSTATAPSAASGRAVAFDTARDRLVLFGGSTSVAETWEWDGSQWSDRTVQTDPSRRSSLALTYDRGRQRMVLFGGQSPAGYVSDTWEWDGAAWTDRSPATGPSARIRPGMAYDQSRGRVVLFGGLSANPATALGDTWEWDGATWQSLSPSVSPPPLGSPAMAYDVSRQRTVLYGGGATWEWDGVNWQKASPAASPPLANYRAIAYDATQHRVVVWGIPSTPQSVADTWGWDGTNWTPLWTPHGITIDRPNFNSASMAYDTIRQRLVLLGRDSNDTIGTLTYTWDGTTPATTLHSIWQRANATTRPSPRFEDAIAFDEARGAMVFFGGLGSEGGATYHDDTWLLTLTPELTAGSDCTSDASCSSGHCVDHVCCNTACTDQCAACNVTNHLGVCSPVTGAPVGERPACGGTPGACALACDGTNTTACALPQCRAASCSSGVATGQATCETSGVCPDPTTTSCGAYACGATACKTTCTQAADCAGANVCLHGGVCGPALVVTPADATVPAGTALAFQASGGSGAGYAWSFTTNASGGSIGANSGVYVAGTTLGASDVVRVTDAAGNTANATAHVPLQDADAGPDGGVDAGAEPTPEAGPEPTPEAGPDPTPEAGPEPMPEAGPDPTPEAGPEPIAEAGPEPMPEAGPAPMPEAGPEPIAEAGPDPTPEAGPAPMPEAGPAPMPEAGADAADGADASADANADASEPPGISGDNAGCSCRSGAASSSSNASALMIPGLLAMLRLRRRRRGSDQR
ncbi:MAG TPA: kelch repeat-containing protein [Polyangiaceae bacterium]|jgi:MYXO-CTERM domain-containing protein